jgi:YesN/AraC family two-component response regulator
VALAESGAEALEALGAFQADIVISDFRMPGMDGVELLGAVKRSWPRALRIILSGFADLDSVGSSFDKGDICRFITKPWDDEELVVLLRRLLAEPDAAEPDAVDVSTNGVDSGERS